MDGKGRKVSKMIKVSKVSKSARCKAWRRGGHCAMDEERAVRSIKWGCGGRVADWRGRRL